LFKIYKFVVPKGINDFRVTPRIGKCNVIRRYIILF